MAMKDHPPAVTLIVGHRGTGKSTFLRRGEALFRRLARPGEFVDLDQEIERRLKRSVAELFEQEGEDRFRQLERQTLAAIQEEQRSRDDGRCLFVALGAGFVGELPTHARVIWLRRVTDSDGRVFLDRPRLNSSVSPLSEYRERFEERERRYRNWSTDSLILPEGWEALPLEESSPESLVFELARGSIGGWLTLDRQSEGAWGRFVGRRLSWGVERLELRDDLLSDLEIEVLCERVPAEHLLLSFRRSATSELARHLEEDRILWDWPLELDGDASPPGVPSILSAHERRDSESVGDVARRLTDAASGGTHLKLACEVHSLDELWEGHVWWQQEPQQRSFLPRSDCDRCVSGGVAGRWRWYRLLHKGKMMVNFFREDEGSASDQPTLIEWASAPISSSFAAILGDPVRHSRTPTEHREFFATMGLPVLSIQLRTKEFVAENLERLGKLGLSHAAITSPLKATAFQLCDETSSSAQDLESVNTVQKSTRGWTGTNTDIVGLTHWLRESLAAYSVEDLTGCGIAVWGGGGTRSTLMAALPDASFYSARNGTAQAGSTPLEAPSPSVLIWAVGRSRQTSCVWPPAAWRPKVVLDLNYAEDSPGREYAQALGCPYESGLTMFRAQAAAQRAFWTREAQND